MFKMKIFTLAFILIFSALPCYAEDTSLSYTESILDISAPQKPTGGINFEAVEMFETESSFYSDANASAASELTAEEYIYQECMKHSPQIMLAEYQIHKDDIDEFFYGIAIKNPELLVHTGFAYSVNPNTSTVVRIAPYYINSSLAEDNNARALMEEKISEYIEYVSECPDKIGKLLLIHDKMTEECMYDYTPYVYEKKDSDYTGYHQYVKVHDYKAHHAYGVFANKEAVCQGFAQAIYTICKKLGINADFVISDERYLNHMWNYIEADGQWYHLDVTWDEVYNTTLDYHDYFLLSDATISKDHKSKSTWTSYTDGLKDCTSTRFESNHIFNFPDLSHITYVDGKYTLPFKLGPHTAIFESETLYTGPIITSAPIKLTNISGIFFTAVTNSLSDISAVAVFSNAGKIQNISSASGTLSKNTLLEFEYRKASPGQTLSCMFMDLNTLIPYSKKITIN